MSVAGGQATELDRMAPFSTLLTCLQGESAPGLDVSSFASATDRGQFGQVDRLGEILEDHSRQRPLLVLIDDAQWMDEMTAFALRILVPGLSSSPVVWLLSRRRLSGRRPPQEAIDWLIDQGTRLLPLEPLDDDAVAQICETVLGAIPDSGVLSLVSRCSGNPFLLRELLTTLSDAGQLAVSDGTATIVRGTLPANFVSAVGARLRELSEDARKLLEAGAVLSRPFTAHEAARLMGFSAVGLLSAVKEAIEGGTLVDQGSNLVFRHDLIREAVYDELPGPVLSVLHREAADVVREEGRSAIEVVEHLVRSGRHIDHQMVGTMRDEVKKVAEGAPSSAADLILRMVNLLDERDPAGPELVADAVRLLASAGRVGEARDLAKRTLRGGLTAESESGLLLGLAEALKHAGRNAEVVEHTRRALARPDVPDAVRARLLAIHAHGLLYIDDLARADSASRQAEEVAEAAGDLAAMVFGMVARTVTLRARGRLADAVELAREAVQVADRTTSDVRHRHPRLWLAPALGAMDRLAEADAVCEIGQREAGELGTAWSQPLWHYQRARLRIANGRLDDAAAEAEAGLRFAEQLAAYALMVPLLGLLAYIAIQRGEDAAGNAHLDSAGKLVTDGIGGGMEDLGWPMALAQDAAGKPEAAMRTLDEIFRCLPDRMLLLVFDVRASATLVSLAQRVGDSKRAQLVVDTSRALADRNPMVSSFAGAAKHAEGLIKQDLNTLRDAVAAFRRGPRRLGLALALEDTAAAEFDAGNRQGAVKLLEESSEIARISGAHRDLARIQERLTELNIPRKPALHGTSRWNCLTESELRVALLVADGLTNREVAARLFLSPHTVDSHLRHSFTKLGVSSRVELTRQVLANTEDG
ncbi:DNA-binding CsgD family transcriptional regulator [Haloactinomyces albus]|uniref:DNA-binding CsgD family transcriptional regulator n=2 Tax=Haloactinomyces albus TaxID=1352928 RepID=A0AAE3ZBR1_9ACTN|nr:DNA-binding CsgD family transcriptional regulator [Haloactinomyces albus]